MTHTIITKGLNLFAGLALISGISITTIQAPTYANLSGVGSLATERPAPSNEVTLRPAATAVATINHYRAADAGIQLSIGMLLIVLGFFVHGLARTQNERSVHITAIPSKPKKHKPTWIWMEMRI